MLAKYLRTGRGDGGTLDQDGVDNRPLHLTKLHAQAVDDEERQGDEEGPGEGHGGGDVVLLAVASGHFVEEDNTKPGLNQTG